MMHGHNGFRRVQQVDTLTIPITAELLRLHALEQHRLLSSFDELLVERTCALRQGISTLTLSDCTICHDVLHTFQMHVHEAIRKFDVVELSAAMQPYGLQRLLSLLHQLLMEGCVLVKGVRGQCAHGRLGREPTGVYWHFCEHMHEISKTYQQAMQSLHVLAFGQPSECRSVVSHLPSLHQAYAVA